MPSLPNYSTYNFSLCPTAVVYLQNFQPRALARAAWGFWKLHVLDVDLRFNFRQELLRRFREGHRFGPADLVALGEVLFNRGTKRTLEAVASKHTLAQIEDYTPPQLVLTLRNYSRAEVSRP